jgi:hypothetical protein
MMIANERQKVKLSDKSAYEIALSRGRIERRDG